MLQIRFLLNTLRLDSAEIRFPIKHFESVYDLTNLPHFWELYKKEKFVCSFRGYTKNINLMKSQVRC